ncbi:MAG: iron ABC transporter permease [Acidimicrobiales bacterium]|jgi:iron complex transport system permease protein
MTLAPERELEHPKTYPFFEIKAVGGPTEPPLFPTRLRAVHLLIGFAFLLAAATASVLVGPADLSPGAVLQEIASKLPLVHVHPDLSTTGAIVVWQLRVPRLVLGGLVGAMLAVAGASYQGVFCNPLADPYLLGVASGAGLGATVAVVEGPALAHLPIDVLPPAAFLGAVVAVAATFALGRSRGADRAPASLVLSGVAVAAFFTAVQTFLQQQNTQDIAAVYTWILGGLATAGWGQVEMIWPYIVAAIVVLLACRRLLDVLSVGDEEATSVGVRAGRVRLVVVVAATLGTAAAVSVSGLIGFVGIIVPHTIRLLAGPSYRRILPLAVLFGAGFLIFADLLARTVLSPQEIPLGVVTAFLGAPFFLVVLRQARRLS